MYKCKGESFQDFSWIQDFEADFQSAIWATGTPPPPSQSYTDHKYMIWHIDEKLF